MSCSGFQTSSGLLVFILMYIMTPHICQSYSKKRCHADTAGIASQKTSLRGSSVPKSSSLSSDLLAFLSCTVYFLL